MSVKIAGLYATLTVDATGLVAGTNQAKTALTGVAAGANTTNANMLALARGLAGPILGFTSLTGAGVLLIKTIKDSVKGFNDYALAVDASSEKTGMAVEELSRLIQVADDFRITQDTVTAAMQFAVKQGYEPSKAWLMELSDQMAALETPADRTRLAITTFGRLAGPEMARLLGEGGAALDEYMSSIENGLIITDEAVRKAEEYYAAQDQLNDRSLALKMTLGESLTPVLTELTNKVNDGVLAWQNMDGQIHQIQDSTDKLGGSTKVLGDTLRILWEGLTWGWVGELVDSMDKTKVDAFTDSIKGLADASIVLGDAGDEIRDYGDQLSAVSAYAQDYTTYSMDLATAHAILAGAEQELANSWGLGADEVTILEEKVKDAKTAVEELEVAHKRQTDMWMLGVMTQQLGIEGFTEAEMKALLQYQVDSGLITQAAMDSALEIWNSTMKMVAGYDEVTGSLGEVKNGIKDIPTDSTPFTDMSKEMAEGFNGVIGPINAITTAINNIPTSKEIWITIHTNQNVGDISPKIQYTGGKPVQGNGWEGGKPQQSWPAGPSNLVDLFGSNIRVQTGNPNMTYSAPIQQGMFAQPVYNQGGTQIMGNNEVSLSRQTMRELAEELWVKMAKVL